MFAGQVIPGFGSDTAAGLVPIPQVAVHYAVFFGLGATVHLVPKTASGLGDGWAVMLPLGIACFPAASSISHMSPLAYEIAGNEPTRRVLSALGQSLFCWLLIFGCIGVCRRWLSKERVWIRYLSDSAYWLYLAHLPLVILVQLLLKTLTMPAMAKFWILLVASSTLLLATYEWGVRYTFIGARLNGPRSRNTTA